ncbi:carboxylesterase family protein [Arthrobacter sp. AL08]|uniref:carboxylesterase family protein n=1 Tax=Micrococcaceae TaxID=1268 RepID=UPI001CFFCF05|nr:MULTISPECIES: carboxylesterase family protein [Micrococcaceae]MCB5281148.1 Para-nitrobenzyl esterase [Arthrobacter sp. ES1]MDI3240911.1 carboxylesterase family protein [Arthrobacter sp. AL05]MDI3277113.1 carboxylesterase family protein [Arthrobacter sp. AL08]MDJ0352362.1 carboxylesterase family protein [Pseudarthrobacter sp. PH31-O2]WGZ79547.1 carboxylesterase family protein [Arthrobacter sp. EM1]
MNDDPAFSPPSGPVTGWRDGEVLRASGIPYASAGRFQPPVPVPDRTAVLAATSLSPACPQAPVPFLDEILGTRYGELPGSEDCQRLSITMPAGLTAHERVPVMVWLHGGSYTSGSGDLAIFDPKSLVAENRVIVVSVTYRLGLFGYLASGTGRPANLGLLDQLEAFRWVQRNISAFGGDPANVTAFGQSAGGDAVAHLMATAEAPALFRRAIIQSAPLGITRGREKMSHAMGIAAQTVTKDTPAMEVVEIEGHVSQVARKFGLKAAMPFGTQYGHAPLPRESAIEDAWNNTAAGIEVLIGHTSEEARMFLPRNRTVSAVAKVPLLGAAIVRGINWAVTEAVYGRSARKFARRHARAGGTAYSYVLSWAAPGNVYGAAHTVDLPLLFGDQKTWEGAGLLAGADWAEINAQGRELRAVWARFAAGEGLGRRGGIPGALRYRAV